MGPVDLQDARTAMKMNKEKKWLAFISYVLKDRSKFRAKLREMPLNSHRCAYICEHEQ